MHGLLYFTAKTIQVKFLHLFVSFLFFSFAIVQWNDPDSFIWIIMYLVVSGTAFLAFQSKFYFKLCIPIVLVLALSLSFYIPDVISWFQDGMPNIADSMKASSPYIELVREFFGLLISLVAMTYYLTLSKKKNS